jgi:hypothetical protein
MTNTSVPFVGWRSSATRLPDKAILFLPADILAETRSRQPRRGPPQSRSLRPETPARAYRSIIRIEHSCDRSTTKTSCWKGKCRDRSWRNAGIFDAPSSLAKLEAWNRMMLNRGPSTPEKREYCTRLRDAVDPSRIDQPPGQACRTSKKGNSFRTGRP